MRAAVAILAVMAAGSAAAQQLPADRRLSRGLTYVEDAATIDVESRQSVAIDLSGTFSVTLTPEVTVDDGTWRAVQFLNLATGARTATITAAGAYLITPTTGAKRVRARASTYGSGTATVFIRASSATPANPPDVTATGAQQFTATPGTVDTALTGQAADFDIEAAATSLRLTAFTARESAATAAVATVVLRPG